MHVSKHVLRATLVAGAAITACQFTPGALPGNKPNDGGVDAPPDAGQCAGPSQMCVGDTLRTCSSAGTMATDTTCAWGCSMTGSAHCAQIDPAGGAMTAADATADTALADKTLDMVSIDGDSGKIGTFVNSSSVRGQGTGVINGIDYELRGNVAVFRFAKLSIGTVWLSGSHPIALFADQEISVSGVVEARCVFAYFPQAMIPPTQPGPGGFAGGAKGANGSGSGGGGSAEGNEEGGGGGGYGASGGIGGDGDGAGGNTPGAGGTPYGDATITTLVGGAGGGGGSGGMNSGSGGGGGGAVQLVSNTSITINTGGGINAGGCAGKNGAGGMDGGGGGGAGGTLLLEAPTVRIDGALAVNGGGGGGGANNLISGAGVATSGLLSRMPAAGAGTAGAPGGAGGAGDGTMAGGAGSNAGNHGGGGGGGVGRIRINTKSGLASLGAGAVLSPSFTDTDTTCTQGAAKTH